VSERLQGKSTRPGVVMCNACRKPFTATVGTIFEDCKIPLNKWLRGFRFMAGNKKGISAHQLHCSLGITYKSAWFMAHHSRLGSCPRAADGMAFVQFLLSPLHSSQRPRTPRDAHR